MCIAVSSTFCSSHLPTPPLTQHRPLFPCQEGFSSQMVSRSDQMARCSSAPSLKVISSEDAPMVALRHSSEDTQRSSQVHHCASITREDGCGALRQTFWVHAAKMEASTVDPTESLPSHSRTRPFKGSSTSQRVVLEMISRSAHEVMSSSPTANLDVSGKSTTTQRH